MDVERGSGCVVVPYMRRVAWVRGLLAVSMHRSFAQEAPVGRAGKAPTGLVTFSNPLVWLLGLWVPDRHRGWRASGRGEGLYHQPRGIPLTESVETLTWAERGSLPLAREQHSRSLLAARAGRERIEPGLNSLDVGRGN